MFEYMTIKYLFKYMYKGSDAANLVIAQKNGIYDHDEIKQYQNTRYVSSMEATYKLFEFQTEFKSHTVYRLPVHLIDTEQIIFTDSQCVLKY